MQKNEKLIGMLNDLMRVNNDRFDGYKNALKVTCDIDQDLRLLFYNMADQSRKNTSALITQILKLRTSTRTGAAYTGKIYSAWVQWKKEFAATDRQSVLGYCEYMETLVHQAYDIAATLDDEIPTEILELVNGQKFSMLGFYNIINNYHHGFYESKVA